MVGCWLESFLGVPGAARAGMGGTLEYRYAETLIISYGVVLSHGSAAVRCLSFRCTSQSTKGIHSTVEH